MSKMPLPKEVWLQWYGDLFKEDELIEPPHDAEITWCSEEVFDHDVRYIREDLVMIGWKCQNPDCGEVLFGPNKPDTCHCGGELVLATEVRATE